MREDKTERTVLEDMAVLAIGACGFSVSVFTSLLDSSIQLFVLLTSLFLIGLSSLDVSRLIFNFHPFSFLKQFQKNKQGLGWILIVGLGLSIPMCALVYWVLDYPFNLITEHMMTMYTFTGTMAYAWMATHVIISYLLAFTLIYSVIWVIVNSKSPGVYY
jgi:signal transduction histidine kinase